MKEPKRKRHRRRFFAHDARGHELAVKSQWNSTAHAVSLALVVAGASLTFGDFDVSPVVSIGWLVLGGFGVWFTGFLNSTLERRGRELDAHADDRWLMAREEAERQTDALWRSGERQDTALYEWRQVSRTFKRSSGCAARTRQGRDYRRLVASTHRNRGRRPTD